MNGLPYYKAYPRDFFEGTVGMSLELKGAYRLVLDLIYQHGGRLPDESRFISGHLGCSVRAWNGYRAALLAAGKIVADLGIISNFRADKELITLGSFQEKQRENGSKPKKNKALDVSMAKPNGSHTDTDTDTEEEREESPSFPPPAKTKKKSAAEPEGFEEFWAGYPKRVKKPDALRAYAKALKKADPPKILAGMLAYAESRRGEDPQYTAHPASWLNAERWNDEISKTGGNHGKPARLDAMLRGAAAPPVDRGPDRHPSQPLLAAGRSAGNP